MCLASERHSSVRYLLAALVALAYSFGRVVRREVHQGLDLGEGREVGTDDLMLTTTWSSEGENQLSICSGDGLGGAGGT